MIRKLFYIGICVGFFGIGFCHLLYNSTPTSKESVVLSVPNRPVEQKQEVSRSTPVKKHIIHAKVTAYAPHDNKSGICNDGTPNTTSTMTYPHKGVVAVDPKKIPYGTQLYIPGYGVAHAEDTGGALRKYNGIQIDVVMDTYKEAKAWGVQYLDVMVEE